MAGQRETYDGCVVRPERVGAREQGEQDEREHGAKKETQDGPQASLDRVSRVVELLARERAELREVVPVAYEARDGVRAAQQRRDIRRSGEVSHA